MKQNFFTQALQERDPQLDQALRPTEFGNFIGQPKLKDRLDIIIKAAASRKEALDHLLFFGPPGLGKTTLAHIIAKCMGVNIRVTSGPVVEKPGDLAGLLTNLQERDIIFIDEIHRLNHTVEEYLYPAMEDFCIDIIIDQGPSARSVRLNLPKFTLIGATTRAGLLTSPLRSRFGMVNRLDYYEHTDLKQIIGRSAKILGIDITEQGAMEIAKRSRGTPRIANNLLKRVRDYAQVRTKENKVTPDIADKALSMLDVDSNGLDEMDKRIIQTIIHKFNGGPVGINTIAVAVGEEPDTIEELYEPYLIQQGYIQRTSAGRIATSISYKHFKIQPKAIQAELWNLNS